MPDYPLITNASNVAMQLNALAESVGVTDPGYFDDKACPYPADLKPFLKRMFRPEGDGDEVGAVGKMLDRVPIFSGGDGEGEGIDVVLAEVEATIEEMKALERTEGLETNDRIALIRAKTTLLERWSGLKERIFTLKEMSEFQQAVIQTMEEVLSVDQRADFVSRLKDFRSVSSVK